MKLFEFSAKFLKAYSKARNTKTDLIVIFLEDSSENYSLGPIGVITDVNVPYEYGTPGVPNAIGFICKKEWDMTERNGVSSDEFNSWLSSSRAKSMASAKVYFKKDFTSDKSNVRDTKNGIYYPEKIALDKQTAQIMVICTKI